MILSGVIISPEKKIGHLYKQYFTVHDFLHDLILMQLLVSVLIVIYLMIIKL